MSRHSLISPALPRLGRVHLGLMLATLAATPSWAQAPENETLQPAFENTILSTYPDGRTARLWLNSDGSYRAQGRRKDPSDGHWRLKGSKICLKQSHPFPSPFSFCTSLPAGGVGAAWSAKAVTGEAIRVTLVSGRP